MDLERTKQILEETNNWGKLNIRSKQRPIL